MFRVKKFDIFLYEMVNVLSDSVVNPRSNRRYAKFGEVPERLDLKINGFVQNGDLTVHSNTGRKWR